MAENETEYRFPDELDDNQENMSVRIEKPEENINIEIEIEDDTPPEDRNRKPPMSQEKIDELEKDELTQYTEDVRSKMSQLKKAMHDERRAKEAALREHQEAIYLARQLMDERNKFKQIVERGEKSYVDTIQHSANLELQMAKRAYKEAYESGDVDAMTEAQHLLNVASMKVRETQNFRITPLQEEQIDVKIPQRSVQQPPPPDNRAIAWQERNPWFGQDEEMTAMAYGLHEKLKNSGVVPGSDRYYAELDKTIRRRFPENFEDEEPPPERVKKNSIVVAPATRSTNSNKVKLKTSELNIAKKLGLTPEQYAIEARKLER
jgi:hypothetical protein